jgi:transcriptional regulator with XRE-family HTH domain
MSFGNFIRMKRVEAGYTLRKFAAQVDISPTFVSRMERDEIDPPGEDKINAMAQALAIDAEELTLMAGRVPVKIKEMILHRPQLVPLLRTANTKSDYDLQRLIDSVIHKKTEGL